LGERDAQWEDVINVKVWETECGIANLPGLKWLWAGYDNSFSIILGDL